MRLIKQRTKTDCGAACIELFAGISWIKARDALLNLGRETHFSTTTVTMRAAALRHFGVITSKRLQACGNGRTDAPLRATISAC